MSDEAIRSAAEDLLGSLRSARDSLMVARPIAGGMGGLAAAIPLAQLLLPLLPGLIQSVAALVETIRTHAETPGPAKEDLSPISTQLDELVRLIQQVRV